MARSSSLMFAALLALAQLSSGALAASSSSSGSSSTVTVPRNDLAVLDARSGLRTWVDPTTPDAALTYTSS
ncbi:Beta-glucan synthesis-associated protein skn1, partial [Globisporangium polare]